MTLPLPTYWFAGSSNDDVGALGDGRRDDAPPAGDPRPDRGVDRRMGMADEALTRGIRDGDASLFGRLFDAYWAPLARFAALYTRSDDEAEDVAAQVFAALWEGRGEWMPNRSVELYLYGAVRHRTRNVHRAAQRQARNVHDFAEVGESPTSGAPMLRADESVLADERRELLLRAVNGLTDRPREVLLLRWLRGLEFGEIAQLLDISRNTVHVTYHRALQQLRQTLPALFE